MLILEKEERPSMLKARIRPLDYIPPYCKELSHMLINISNLLTLIVIVMHSVNVAAHTPTFATWVAR